MTYRQLLDVFFNRVDPTTLNRQGNDRGTQYRSAVYTHDEEQLQQAQQKIAEVNEQLSQVGPGDLPPGCMERAACAGSAAITLVAVWCCGLAATSVCSLIAVFGSMRSLASCIAHLHRAVAAVHTVKGRNLLHVLHAHTLA